jgi:hypothetical protein
MGSFDHQMMRNELPYDIEASKHVYISQVWSCWSVAKKKSIVSAGPKVRSSFQQRLIFLHVG